MSVNKVIYGDTTIIDTSEVTVTADTLLKGYTALDATGSLITGELEMGGEIICSNSFYYTYNGIYSYGRVWIQMLNPSDLTANITLQYGVYRLSDSVSSDIIMHIPTLFTFPTSYFSSFPYSGITVDTTTLPPKDNTVILPSAMVEAVALDGVDVNLFLLNGSIYCRYVSTLYNEDTGATTTTIYSNAISVRDILYTYGNTGPITVFFYGVTLVE